MAGGWQEFFHAPIDLSSLALFRVLLGLLIVADAVSYARSASAILHPDGMLPFGVWRNGPDRRYFSVLRWLPASRPAVTAMIVLYAIAGACLSVGLGTRWAAAIAFLAGVSLHHRNRHVLHSGDALLRILTFLSIFSPAGSLWSVDAALGPPVAEPGSPWALRLMQLQVSLLYLHAVRFKLRGRTWRRGTATHYATHLLTHRRRRLPAWLDGAAAHRTATWGTLAVELAAGALLWLGPTRALAIGGAAVLHLTLQLLLRMHLFQWTMLVSLILFVPGETTAGLFAIG